MAKQVYAGNLSWETSDEALQEFMAGAGKVSSAKVIRYPDGRSKGWGLVEFADPSGAEAAIATLSDIELMGRKIFIREDREPGGGSGGGKGKGAGGKGGGKGSGGGRGRARAPLPEPEEDVTSGTALYVGNLPWSTTSQQLREVFSEYSVIDAEVKAGYDGRSRGYGIVTFESEDDAAAALALGGYNLDGREVLVRFDRQASALE